MEQLHYPDELRSFAEVPIEDATVKPAELKLATQLVEQAATDEFHPEQYKDEVRERMMELIERKIEGEDITLTPTAEPEHKIIDIMAALEGQPRGRQEARAICAARGKETRQSQSAREETRCQVSTPDEGVFDARGCRLARTLAHSCARARALRHRDAGPRRRGPRRVLVPGPRAATHGQGARRRQRVGAPYREDPSRAREPAADRPTAIAPSECRSTAIA